MSSFCHLLLRRGFAAGLFALGLVQAIAAPVKFDIAAQPADAALRDFSKQAAMEVSYNARELKAVQASTVKGELEPKVAIDQLLAGTGFEARQTSPRNFAVTKIVAPVTTGSVKGSLTGEGGKGVANILVSIRETAQSTETDKYGVYAFPNVAAGTYVLVASAPGYQTLHITDVRVNAGRELMLGKEELRKAPEGVLKLEPFVVKADTVEQLEKFEVTGAKGRPFTSNMDIPRTINDVQPYFVFDSKTIDQSGAANVGDFLKQRVTMNAVAQTNGQISGFNQAGNTSSINLRALGTDHTLILVNGRQVATVAVVSGTPGIQPDLNGIPLSAIERIEVLPTSASGIYGGSAIGGVVNVILKKDYVGGEIRATYDNTFDTDSVAHSVSASYGMALEGGKTHVMLSASWADSTPLLLQDRVSIFANNIAKINLNSPTFLGASTTPWLGSLPNITPNSSSQTTLTLKNGAVINSRNTHISAGTSPSTSSSDLYASLLANGGQWVIDFPATTQAPTGLLRPFGTTPTNKSFQASVRRQMLPKLELFAEFSYNANRTETIYNALGGSLLVSAAAPSNPFTTSVNIRFPNASDAPFNTNSISRSATLGAIAQLPQNWTAEFDYTWSDSRYHYHYFNFDSSTAQADVTSGVLNPFVDTLLYPLALQKYRPSLTYDFTSELSDIALRGSGPLPKLPWGQPSLTIGLERRIAHTPRNTGVVDYPTDSLDSFDTDYPRDSVTESAYAELLFPLVKQGWLPLVRTLELQASGREDRYTVDSGTSRVTYFPNQVPPLFVYTGTTLNGQPYFGRASYDANNYTLGVKYEPIQGVILRASRASAFMPPTPTQLLKNPLQSTSTTSITDPKNGQRVSVFTVSGGNPDLRPQSSTSTNLGIVLEPRWNYLKGLRLNAEYYSIDQFDAIASLSAQSIVGLESLYPDRVTRDVAGNITLVDISMLNLYNRKTQGWDLSADYLVKTGAGTFALHAAQSIILHLKTQYSLTAPAYDAVNYPGEAGAAKYKSNAVLAWDWHHWSAAWTASYISDYRVTFSPGGPSAAQSAAAGLALNTTYTLAQGGDTIPSQSYHDLLVGYTFGQQSDRIGKLRKTFSTLCNGLTVQFGVRNVFNKIPPMDAFYSSNYYESPYGDMRLRSYWLSVKKAF